MPTLTTTEAQRQTQRLLTNPAPGARMRLEITPDGYVNVTETTPLPFKDKYTSKQALLKAEYGHLMGHTLTLTEAAKKYNVPRGTVGYWFHQSNYIQPVGDSYPNVFDEAEIAYCVEMYRHRRANNSKAPFFDENGLPYEIKHPNLASYRQQKKEQKN